MTAVGVESQITEALLLRLAALTLSPALQVSYPNSTFPAAGQTKPPIYLEVRQLRSPTEGIGISKWDERTGLFQIDVVYTPQDGALKVTEIADKVANWFKRGTHLVNGAVRVDINETPEIASPIADAPYTRTPITVRYRVFTP